MQQLHGDDEYHAPSTDDAAKYRTHDSTDQDGDNIPNDQIYLGTTLTVSTLANGGSPSSIGGSSNAASNLYHSRLDAQVHGRRREHRSAIHDRQRIGGTIDASGSGPSTSRTPGPWASTLPNRVPGTQYVRGVNGGGCHDRSRVTSTEDLDPGCRSWRAEFRRSDDCHESSMPNRRYDSAPFDRRPLYPRYADHIRPSAGT